MRVCIIYNWFKPAYKAGGPIQSLVNLAAHLGNSCKLEIICSNRDADGTLLDVETGKWLTVLGTKVYYSGNGFWSYAGFVRKYPPDVLFINGIYSFQYNILPLFLFKGRKILSVRGMLHPGALSEKKLKKKIFLYGLKLLRLAGRCEFHATSEEERAFIQRVFGENCKIWVIPNLPRQIECRKMPPKVKGQLILGSVALISPMKNHLAVLSALKKSNQKIEYRIYGPVKDEKYWKACKEVMRELPANIAVTYYGDLPADNVVNSLEQIHVFIQPSKSENFGHSIYEALAVGRPVITSYYTPWNQLQDHGAGFNVDPDNETSLIQAMDFFSEMDNDELLKWNRAAREYVTARIKFGELIDAYMAMFSCC